MIRALPTLVLFLGAFPVVRIRLKSHSHSGLGDFPLISSSPIQFLSLLLSQELRIAPPEHRAVQLAD